jgi:hypothetical protein
MLDCWEGIDEVAQVLTVATSCDELLYQIKTVFFGSAIAVLDATIKAIAATAEQFLHCTSQHDIRRCSHKCPLSGVKRTLFAEVTVAQGFSAI